MRLTHHRTAIVGVAVGVVAALGLAPAAFASPSTLPANTAKVDCVVFDAVTDSCTTVGVVYAITHVGDRTYIGGRFQSVSGAERHNVAAVRADGTLDPTWNPDVDGTVYALAASSDGSKVFIGGGFTTVGGQPRGRLAAVTAESGAPIAGWTTQTSNNLVRALTTDAEDRLYVGGTFGRIGGKAIPRLAAVSQSTGAVDTTFAPKPSGSVRALGLSDDGSKLYAGGGFGSIAGQARPGAAELDAATGAVTSFAPTDGGVVIALDVTPNGRFFFATTTNRTWAYDPAKGGVPEYRVRTGGDVQTIVATDDEVYIGGHFDKLPEAKLSRVGLASFDTSDGTTTAWNPSAPGSFQVWAMDLSDTSLSIGGDFTRVSGLARRGYTRFDF